jgi:hypothetical protein
MTEIVIFMFWRIFFFLFMVRVFLQNLCQSFGNIFHSVVVESNLSFIICTISLLQCTGLCLVVA